MSDGLYLGRQVDPESGDLGARLDLDSADLLTHGLIVGMTGYYGLLDLGIRSAVGQYVTRYWTAGDMEGVNRTLIRRWSCSSASP